MRPARGTRPGSPVQQRLGGEQLGERHGLGLDARRGACGWKAVEVVVRVVRGGDEVAAGELQRGRRDPPQDRVLGRAVARRQRIALDVAAAGVEEAVVAAARARREVAALDEERPHAAHRQVAQDAGAGRAPADDEDVDLGAGRRGRHVRPPRRIGSAPRR